jgi:hypothetical protein
MALTTKFDKFNIPDDDDDDDESSDKEEASSKCSNSALTHHNKKGKNCGWDLKISAFTMRMESVYWVEGFNRSDLDSHADANVVGKEVLVFTVFNREVTLSGYDPAWDKVDAYCVFWTGICYPTNWEDGALDHSSRHSSSTFGAQLVDM